MKAGDPDGLQDAAGAGHPGERAAAGAEHVAAAHQGSYACRVQEAGLAQVGHDVNGATLGQPGHHVTELRGGVRVDLALEPQHGTVAARGNWLQVKGLHTASVARLVAGPRAHIGAPITAAG